MVFFTASFLLPWTLVLLTASHLGASEVDLSKETFETGGCDSDDVSALALPRVRTVPMCPKGIHDTYTVNGFCLGSDGDGGDDMYAMGWFDTFPDQPYSCVAESAPGAVLPCEIDGDGRCYCNWGKDPYCEMVCNYNNTYGREPAAKTNSSSEVMYDDVTVIAQTADSGDTPDCGWYGCRVAAAGICSAKWYIICDSGETSFELGPTQPSDPMALVFVHGAAVASHQPRSPDPAAAMGFYLRRPVGSTKAPGECVSYGDAVVIALTSDTGKEINCGWYGCGVATMVPDARFLRFAPGGDMPESFYLRPPVDSGRSGCIRYGDDVVIAQTADAGNTPNCGWYGCRVARMYEEIWPGTPLGSMHFDHGGDQPQVFYLRPTPP